MPAISEAEGAQLIRDLFDQNMKVFSFTLGPLGKIAGLPVIELRAKPKIESAVQSSESQIYDEFSFPLKGTITFKDGQKAKFEFSKIAFNEKFDLPQCPIPNDSLKVVWDFRSKTVGSGAKSTAPQNLKLVKSLQHEFGMTLNYYRNGGQFLSVVRYKNLGLPPKRGIRIEVGKQTGFLLLGPMSNVLTISVGDTTTIYSSNLLIDDLLAAAAKP